MNLEQALKDLDAQLSALREKNERGERILVSDLPRIVDAPKVTKRERQRIYRGQEGFEFHGMQSAKLVTLLDSFNGSAVWVPHSCKEFYPLEQFEDKLFSSYAGASGRYGTLIVQSAPQEEHATDSLLMFERKKSLEQNMACFPWMSMVKLDYGSLHEKDPGLARTYFHKRFIKPRFAIIDAAGSINSPVCYDRFKDTVNKLWVYMAWTQRPDNS